MSEAFLERVWAEREESIYPQLFGDLGPGIFTLHGDTFETVFQQSPDPRWLFTGVFESSPGPKHVDWVYVSSGLSNPWEQAAPAESEDEASWLGVEFLFRTTVQGSWAIQLVQRIAAFEILLAHDRFEGRERLAWGDRIPLRAPIVPSSQSVLTYLLVAPPADGPEGFRLETGLVEFAQLVGISEAEAAFGRENDLEALLDVLRRGGAYSTTDPFRVSLI
jgi:hypothetical protein